MAVPGGQPAPADPSTAKPQPGPVYTGVEALNKYAKLWTAEAMHRDAVTSAQYARLVAALGTEQRFLETMKSAWAQDALRLLADRGVVPFAWELAYPRVFAADGDVPGAAGFDVVLGNPPYEVLSERESGRPVGHLQRFFDCEPELAPARGGKDNLY